jgi:hypothetical protein
MAKITISSMLMIAFSDPFLYYGERNLFVSCSVIVAMSVMTAENSMNQCLSLAKRQLLNSRPTQKLTLRLFARQYPLCSFDVSLQAKHSRRKPPSRFGQFLQISDCSKMSEVKSSYQFLQNEV